jgi:CRP-like cAMP-binding protein
MSTEREKLVHFIRQNQPLLNETHASAVAEFFQKKQLTKNELFLLQGKISNEYFFLEEGCIRSFTHNLEGEDVTTGLYTANRVVCELSSFFKRIPSKENYQALSDCNVWVITFETLQQAFHALPEFREFGRALLVNEYAALKTRMLSTLHETAEERYTNLLRSSPDIFQHAPLKNIASFLGITDSSLSRIRKEFVKK